MNHYGAGEKGDSFVAEFPLSGGEGVRYNSSMTRYNIFACGVITLASGLIGFLAAQPAGELGANVLPLTGALGGLYVGVRWCQVIGRSLLIDGRITPNVFRESVALGAVAGIAATTVLYMPWIWSFYLPATIGWPGAFYGVGLIIGVLSGVLFAMTSLWFLSLEYKNNPEPMPLSDHERETEWARSAALSRRIIMFLAAVVGIWGAEFICTTLPHPRLPFLSAGAVAGLLVGWIWCRILQRILRNAGEKSTAAWLWGLFFGGVSACVTAALALLTEAISGNFNQNITPWFKLTALPEHLVFHLSFTFVFGLAFSAFAMMILPDPLQTPSPESRLPHE